MASVTLSPSGASGWSSSSGVAAIGGSQASTSPPSQADGAATLTVSFASAGIGSADTIDGILVEIVCRASNTNSITIGGSYGSGVTLPKGTAKTNATTWGTSLATISLGGASDLWGGSWSAADFNSAWSLTIKPYNGNASARTAYLAYVSVTIYSTPGT